MIKKVTAILVITGTIVTMCACGTNTTATTTAAETTAAETTTADEATTAAQTESQTEAQTDAQTDSQTSVSEGIVIDASMNYFMLQDQTGKDLMFSMPEDGNYENNLADGLLLGHTVKVTYTGNSDNGDAVVTALEDSTITVDLDADVYQTICAINETIKLQDLEGLADYMSWPCYVHAGDQDGEVADRDAFLKLNKEDVFNEDFSMLVDYNLFSVKETEAGIVVGDATPNYILKQDDSGNYMIAGINATK